MRSDIEKRIKEEANYIVENKATVRGCATYFKTSKSTVHQDVTKRLRKMDKLLWEKVGNVLRVNKEERHIRGGKATKEKYEKISQK